jgi:hypothetical protein
VGDQTQNNNSLTLIIKSPLLRDRASTSLRRVTTSCTLPTCNCIQSTKFGSSISVKSLSAVGRITSLDQLTFITPLGNTGSNAWVFSAFPKIDRFVSLAVKFLMNYDDQNEPSATRHLSVSFSIINCIHTSELHGPFEIETILA